MGILTSTQDEARRRLEAGEQAPFAVSAREQTAGRGRLGRAFASPDGASLSLTYAHRSALGPDGRGWIPLAAGLAAIDALAAAVGTDGPALGLKWPNDIHTADGRKLGGILVEGHGAHDVLIGIGLNLRGPVRAVDGSLVPGTAWLLGADGIRPGADDRTGAADAASLREAIAGHLVTALASELDALESSGGDGDGAGTRRRYTMTCLTIGRKVRVEPVGDVAGALHGIARTIEAGGRLVVDLEAGGEATVDIGDVRHLRPGGPEWPATDAGDGVEKEEHGR
ncbi:biotin--[acetyl-CoA-carboxylase] ligase [Brachybacterium sp. GCM10030268]|uniref:biotin--[acetyl-CoA-carboxylase] ligase n=1 Tax=Brachybacterium sp. GCM10030268 TaxID=3273382 RepID=UPI00361188F8